MATSDGDPRRPFAEALIAAIGAEGPIFVYNAGFERSVILELAAAFPDFAPRLQAPAGRLFDLLPLTRDNYYRFERRPQPCQYDGIRSGQRNRSINFAASVSLITRERAIRARVAPT